MQCPKCQFENDETAKFCEECGAKLGRVCPGCGHEVKPKAKFCPECGQPLKKPEQSASPDYSAPHSYTPKHLTEKILTTRSAIEGERKLVTVLFADVTNYTALSEKLDPEEVHQIMDGCFKTLMEEIHRYEGTVNQFTGDGVMALFGAPVAHEDHAQRACHAALSIQKAMAEYGAKIEKEYGGEFKLRIGLNSGPVIVGTIGDDLRMDYTAVGDTTNLASRMEGMAAPGTILVSRNTHQMTREYFTFEPLGEVEVKGKAEPQEAYELIQASTVETRIEASEARGLTRFVGRRNSMNALIDAFDQARCGSGRVVGVVGEAGVGKSRLLLEFRKRLPQGEFSYLEGRCLHFGSSMPYLPLLDIVRSYFGLDDGDRASIRKKKIKEKALGLDANLEHVMAPFQDLLSLPVDDEDYQKLEPQQKRERTFDALRDLLVRESQEHPLVIAIEDLHWIDQTSQEFLDYLIGWLAPTQVMLVLLYRPEFTHAWGSKSYYLQVGLDQLSTATSAELVESILDGAEVVPEIQELILQRTGGNPLFVEELTHSLLENGSIQKQDHQYALSRSASSISVPDTIEGIISARIDRLEDNLKRTMQVASVIGRDFAFRILQTITGMRDELKSHLVNLQRLEFIYEKQLFPELEYIFKHVLTQEVAYNSLLTGRRKEIHEKIGEAIETVYGERLEEFYEMLAYHYSKSENHDRTAYYLRLAGDKSYSRYSPWEAYQFYRKALDTLEKLPESEANKKEKLNLCFSIYIVVMQLGFPEDIFKIIKEGEQLARDLHDDRHVAYFHTALVLYYSMSRGDLSSALKYGESAFRAAKKVGDIDIVARAAILLSFAYSFTGQYLKNCKMAPSIIDRLEKTGNESQFFRSLVAPYPGLCAVYGNSLGMTGDFRQGILFCERGLRKAKEIENLRPLGLVELNYAGLLLIKGDAQKALDHSRKCIAYCEESNFAVNLGMAYGYLGIANYLTGEWTSADEYLTKGIETQENMNSMISLSLFYYFRSKIQLDKGDARSAAGLMENAVQLAQKLGEGQWEAISLIGLGQVFGKSSTEQMGKAESSISRGIEIAEGLHLQPTCAQGYLALGELYCVANDKGKALENLKIAETMFLKMEMEHYLDATRQVLDKV